MTKNKDKKRLMAGWPIFAVILLLMFGFTGCSSEDNRESGAPQIEGLTCESTMEKDYAEGFDVYNYSEGYKLIDVHDAQSGNSVKYLLVPEEGSVPKDLSEDTVVIKKPLKNIYLAASAAMALFSSLDDLEDIAFTATKEKDWYIDEAAEAMREGRMKYAGKYSQPDYEMLLDEGCDLAIESTMIMHSPSVMEKLEEIGIPVFVDQSSYESHPLGRSEWIKLYGVMTGREKEAEAFFDEQKKVISDLEGIENTGKTVAFFYMNSQDQAVVRASDDYIPRMIDIAGGKYIFEDLENPNKDSRSAVVTLSMEEFYEQASDADYLIYNASIESPLTSIEDLTEKSELFEKFKAVRDGNLWTTDKYLYQATDIMGQLIRDMHMMLTGGDAGDMIFLKKVTEKTDN